MHFAFIYQGVSGFIALESPTLKPEEPVFLNLPYQIDSFHAI
jgi:hypothetical protein